MPAKKRFLEGYATVVGLGSRPSVFRVEFVGDPVVRERLLYPQARRDPERVLAVLVDVWLPGEGEPDTPRIEDFFPET